MKRRTDGKMKRKIITVLALALLLSAAVLLSSCSQWQPPYISLDKSGSNVSVKYLSGGGAFEGTNGITVVDVFNPQNISADENGNKSISLIPPESEKRGNNAFEIFRTGYALSGWFIAEPITENSDTAGKTLLDANGAITTVKEDACYILSDKWNFDSDKVTLDAEKTYSSAVPALTLTALWLEHVTFEFYDGETKVGSATGLSVDLPVWDTATGKMNYKNFLSVDGKTVDIDSITYQYIDENGVSGEILPMTDTVAGLYDYDKGVCNSPTVKIYADWLDGEWYRITDAVQLRNINNTAGCYDIQADLDFTNVPWPTLFADGEFTGKIIGNGHKISNVNAMRKNTSSSYSGLFGSLSETSVIENVTFENAAYTIDGSIRGVTYGLLAGANGGATLTNVSVSGKLVFTERLINNRSTKQMLIDGDIVIGAIFGEGGNSHVNFSSVTLEHQEPEKVDATLSIDGDGMITVTYPDGE